MLGGSVCHQQGKADMEHDCTVLVVEDEPLIALDLSLAVEETGHHPVHAATVSQALATLGADRGAITVAILDINLCQEDCFPVADALASSGIPFIFHSAELTHYSPRLVRHGAPSVAKPASAERVVQTALDWLRTCAAAAGKAPALA